jgi:hypothetical protein
MRSVSDAIGTEYARIRKRATEDPGTAGDQGEENWAAVLRGWLPRSYTVVTKGRIISHAGIAGPQVDVLVLKPSYPPALDGMKLYLAEGVAAAFECKITLKGQHIRNATENARALRDAYAPRTGSPYRELHSPLLYGLLAHSHVWKSPESQPIENIESELTSSLGRIAHPKAMLDVLCVADLGLWTASRTAWLGPGQLPEWSPELVRLYGERGSATASYVGAWPEYEQQNAHFTPVGAMIAAVLRRLAWEDPSMRSIADYFRLAGLTGAGRGDMYRFSESTYSEEIRPRITAGMLSNGVAWDEWSVGYF